MKHISTLLAIVLLAGTLNAQIPSGYYNSATGLTGAPLKTALHKIIRSHTVRSYTYAWSAFYSTDDKPNGKVWDMYSDIPSGTPPYEYIFGTNQCSEATTSGEGVCYNREHSFPKSWFGGLESDTMYTDLFALYPTDSYVNERRSNYPYGTVGTTTWVSQNGSKLGYCSYPGYTGIVFEPRDEYKGDFARTYFYMATRYESRIASWENLSPYGNVVLNGTSYPCFEPWFLSLLLAWHAADPVSQKEIDRNNEIYSNRQYNRNPYIDHPEYVTAVWAPSNVLPEPTNYPVNFSAHNIRLQWTDAAGTPLPDGYLIRMSTVGYSSITVPTDGVPVADGTYAKNVLYGINEVWFTNLNPNTTYYFKIFPFSGEGAAINYKTSGTVPQVQKTTTP